ncbi:MAG TPA: HEAT repeat domain-containing protein [Thermodesulfovibrionales bacterium]|nr:HEAT repeat domain-containing protein [Thermodesulfovibrionales bacterium]
MKRLLSDEETEVRRKAVLELEGKPPEASVPLLLKAMEDVSWRVRKTASEVLMGGYAPDYYMRGLIQLLYLDENAGARNSAIEALVRLGKRATPLLIEGFHTLNRDVRKFIIDIIGEIKDRRTLSLLVKALKDEDDNVRASAVEHLGQMGDQTVVDALIEILEGGDLWTAFPAADALGRIGDKRAIPALLHALSVKALREPALKGLSHLSAPETLQHIIPFLTDSSKSIQEETVRTIGVFYHRGVSADFISRTMHTLCGPEIISKLVSHAWSKKTDVRVTAILLLGLMQDERALGPLLELSAEESLSEDVKRALIFIGKSTPKSLLPLFQTDSPYQRRFIVEVAADVASPLYYPVFKTLLDDDDGHVRALAATGLAAIRDPRAAGCIKRLLSDPYEDVQEAAVVALSNLGEGIDMQELINYLKDKSPVLRKNAAMLLGRLGATESVNALGFALKDGDVSVRQAVVEALSSMKTEESVKYLVFALTDEKAHIRASASLSLGSMESDRVVEPLILLLLTDSDDTVRVSAARSLGMIGNKGAVSHLIGVLGDRNGFVVATAMESLGRLGGDEAREALIGMLNSGEKEIKRTAIRALSPFEGSEGIILPYLNDPDWATRTAAVKALRVRANERVRNEIEKCYDREEDPAVRKTIEEYFDVR